MTITHVQTIPSGILPHDRGSISEGFKIASSGAGAQTNALSLSYGTKQAIREVYVYFPAAGDGAYFFIGRGTTSSYVKISSNVYWNAKSFDTFYSSIMSLLGTIIVTDHDGATQDVYVVVTYDYE